MGLTSEPWPMSPGQKRRVWVLRRLPRSAIAGACFATGVLIAMHTFLNVTTAVERWLAVALIGSSLAIPLVVELFQWTLGCRAHCRSETPAWSGWYALTASRALPWCVLLTCSATLTCAVWMAAWVWWSTRCMRMAVSLGKEGHLRIGTGPLVRELDLEDVVVMEDLDLDHLAVTGDFRARTQVFDCHGTVRGVLAPDRADQNAIRQLLLERTGSVSWFAEQEP